MTHSRLRYQFRVVKRYYMFFSGLLFFACAYAFFTLPSPWPWVLLAIHLSLNALFAFVQWLVGEMADTLYHTEMRDLMRRHYRNYGLHDRVVSVKGCSGVRLSDRILKRMGWNRPQPNDNLYGTGNWN